MIGEAGLTTALHEAGYTLTDREPDFVVLGETRTYSFEAITKAIRLILRGARFIASRPRHDSGTQRLHATAQRRALPPSSRAHPDSIADAVDLI